MSVAPAGARPLLHPSTATLPRSIAGRPATIPYLAALVVAMYMMLSIQFFGKGILVSGWRYVPVLLGLTALGAEVAFDPRTAGRLLLALRGFWPLAVIPLSILAGAIVNRVFLRSTDTWLAHGLSYIGFFVGYAIASRGRPGGTGRPIIRTFAVGAVVAYLLLPVGLAQRIPVLHEAAYVFIAWPMYPLLAFPALGLGWRALLLLALPIAGPLSLKNTTTILGGVSLLLLFLFSHVRRFGMRALGFARTWALVAAVGGAAAVFWLAMPRIDGFSTGNTEFRLYCYRVRLQQFYDSPIIGAGWTGPPYVRFQLFDMYGTGRESVAVTHNDHLDLLANGGIAEALLMLAAYAVLARHVLIRLRVEQDRRDHAAVATLSAGVVGGLITMSFNPVLGNPANGWLYWNCVGLLAGWTHYRNRIPDALQPLPDTTRPAA